MNESLRQQYEQSLYKELYHLGSREKTLVIHEMTHALYVRKIRKIYQVKVYTWLKEHPDPHIPRIEDFFEQNGVLTVLEEFVQGESLAQKLRSGTLSDEEKSRILLEVCDGLIFLHSANPPIIHRDIKPENIMIDQNGGVKIIDYDSAKQYHAVKERDTVLIGTEGSAAPEQYGFRQSDERTDVYALGVLIKTMYPGQRNMQAIADKAMEMEPDRRYQTVKELRKKLESRKAAWMIPPGFRSGHPLKMILASIGYLFLICMSAGTNFNDVKGTVDLYLNRAAFFLMMYLLIATLANLGVLRRVFPLPGVQNKLLRILLYALIILLICLSPMIILTVIERVVYG